MTRIFLVLLVTIALGVSPAAAAVYNLANDWSNTQNPFGAWSLYKSPTQLFTINQSDYLQNGTNQHAWADQPFSLQAHVPFWMHIADNDYVSLHGAEWDRTGSNETSAVWTSPEDGVVIISGAVWNTTNYERTMAWELRKNGTMLSSGTLCSNGFYTAENPFYLIDGSGGIAALRLNVVAGDQIQLAFISVSENGNLGDSLGTQFNITSFANVPEPGTCAVLIGGIGCLIPTLRRRIK